MSDRLTASEALAICRNIDRSREELRRVLDWAEASPAPDKIAALLVLATEYPAAVHEIHSELQQILITCAQTDAGPLWECVDGDWNTDRITLALQGLMSLPSVDTLRVVALGEHWLYSLHWHLIRTWAARQQLTLPAHIVAQQTAWWQGGEYGPPPGSDADREYARRRATWPVERNLAPPVPPPPQPRHSGYGEATTPLTSALGRMVRWLAWNAAQTYQALRPGLAPDRIASLAGAFGGRLPEEAYELWRTLDGSPDTHPVPIYGNYRLMPLEEAVRLYRMYRQIEVLAENLVPFAEWNGDQTLCLVCGPEPAAQAEVCVHDDLGEV